MFFELKSTQLKTKQKCKNDERAQVRIYQIKPIQARSDKFGKISYLNIKY